MQKQRPSKSLKLANQKRSKSLSIYDNQQKNRDKSESEINYVTEFLNTVFKQKLQQSLSKFISTQKSYHNYYQDQVKKIKNQLNQKAKSIKDTKKMILTHQNQIKQLYTSCIEKIETLDEQLQSIQKQIARESIPNRKIHNSKKALNDFLIKIKLQLRQKYINSCMQLVKGVQFSQYKWQNIEQNIKKQVLQIKESILIRQDDLKIQLQERRELQKKLKQVRQQRQKYNGNKQMNKLN